MQTLALEAETAIKQYLNIFKLLFHLIKCDWQGNMYLNCDFNSKHNYNSK